MAGRVSGTVSAVIVYAFEGIDERLDLVPLAGRRALDAAARKVGLEAWRALPLPERRAIVAAGSADVVDVSRVLAALAEAPSTPIVARPEPTRDALPDGLDGLDAARWRALRGLDRWALASLASRQRHDGLAALLSELGLSAAS